MLKTNFTKQVKTVSFVYSTQHIALPELINVTIIDLLRQLRLNGMSLFLNLEAKH